MSGELDDNPEWTERDFLRAEPAEALPPQWLAAFPRTGERLLRETEGAPVAIRAMIAAQSGGARIRVLAA